MTNHGGSRNDIGWINRRFKDLERQIKESKAAKRLQAATIGAGGIRVTQGGSFFAEYPDGSESARFGPTHLTDGRATNALQLLDENAANIFGATRTPYDPAFPGDPDGVRLVQVGSDTQDADYFLVFSNQSYMFVAGAEFTMAGGGLNIAPAVGQDLKVQVGTTGSSANANIDSSTGALRRSTSSRRYKQDITDAEVDPATVLAMQPRTWRDKGEVEKHPETTDRYVGFIAEELHELGLGQFVMYDDEGRPDAISYDRLSVALLAVLKDQEKRLAALESAAEADPA